MDSCENSDRGRLERDVSNGFTDRAPLGSIMAGVAGTGLLCFADVE